MYSKGKCGVKLEKGEKIECVIALGYGVTQGVSHKVKSCLNQSTKLCLRNKSRERANKINEFSVRCSAPTKLEAKVSGDILDANFSRSYFL